MGHQLLELLVEHEGALKRGEHNDYISFFNALYRLPNFSYTQKDIALIAQHIMHNFGALTAHEHCQIIRQIMHVKVLKMVEPEQKRFLDYIRSVMPKSQALLQAELAWFDTLLKAYQRVLDEVAPLSGHENEAVRYIRKLHTTIGREEQEIIKLKLEATKSRAQEASHTIPQD